MVEFQKADIEKLLKEKGEQKNDVIEALKRIAPMTTVKLSNILTPLDEKLLARKTSNGKIEIFEIIE